MTAPHIVDSEDGVGISRRCLTRLSTGVTDCLCMGFVDSDLEVPRTRPAELRDLIGA